MEINMSRLNTSHLNSRLNLCAALALGLLLQACALPANYSYQKLKHKETAMPETVQLSPRLQQLFAKTKLVCIGRYALEVPQEAVLNWGPAGFPADIDVIHGGMVALNRRVASDIVRIKEKNKTAVITYNQAGPVEGSWQIRFYDRDTSRESRLLTTRTYINRGDTTFITGWYGRDTNVSVAEQQAYLAKNLRLRATDEVPDEPGFCLEEAFMPDNRYASQESVNAGIYLPSLPDINFSISSNKDAYADYDDFDEYKKKLSLLYRIQGAKNDQGPRYPSRTLLREGKRDVQHWQGEESLIRRNDGTHDFEWAFVGTPKDVANPSAYRARMYSKVEHDTVGAAPQASVTDDEAVALWDKLLSSLKFRVQVPGAPEGSYYIKPGKPSDFKAPSAPSTSSEKQ